LTVLLGLVAAASWGAADFMGGLAGRRTTNDLSATIAFASQFVGLAMFVVVAPMFGGAMSGVDLLWSTSAGLSGAGGIMFLYRGLAIGRMGVVAPITGALAAAIPAAVSPVIGETPAALSWLGIGLALVAIVVVARQPDPAPTAAPATVPDTGVAGLDDSGSVETATVEPMPKTTPPPVAGLREAVLSGCGFAGVGVLLNATSDASELLPFIPMKLVASVVLGMLVWRRREQPREAAASWRLLVGAGVLDNAANVAYLFALRGGVLAVAATLASLYPVGTTLLARVVLDERLARLQQAGFGLALAAVLVIGLSQ